MKKLLFFFGFVAVIAMLEACECCSRKTVTCPAYKDTLAQQWIPYKTKGQLIFAASTGELDTLKLDTVAFSRERTLQNSCSQNNCESSFNIYGRTNSNTEKNFDFGHTFNGNSTSSNGYASVYIRFLKGQLYGTGFTLSGITTPSFGNCPAIAIFLPQTTLNAKPFTNVQEISADTSCKVLTVFKKIFLAKNKGLVGYQTNTDGKLWVLQ